MLSAKDFSIKGIDSEMNESKIFQESILKIVKLPYQWIEVQAPCGAVYYMEMSNYDTMDEFWDAMQDFNDIKCD